MFCVLKRNISLSRFFGIASIEKININKNKFYLQTVWNQLRADKVSVLIWLQNARHLNLVVFLKEICGEKKFLKSQQTTQTWKITQYELLRIW